MEYKGYVGSLEWSHEDKCFFGKVQDTPGTLISYEGATISEAEDDFRGAIDDYLASCKDRGIKPVLPNA